ncbi:hypothetical protein ABVT39_015606 [Epinephelus coioides]
MWKRVAKKTDKVRPGDQLCNTAVTEKLTNQQAASSIMQKPTSSCKPREESRGDERMFSTR